MYASRPPGSSAAKRSTTPTSSRRSSRPARQSARAAATSVSGTPGCTNTAGSAPGPAAIVSEYAGICLAPSDRPLGVIDAVGHLVRAPALFTRRGQPTRLPAELLHRPIALFARDMAD